MITMIDFIICLRPCHCLLATDLGSHFSYITIHYPKDKKPGIILDLFLIVCFCFTPKETLTKTEGSLLSLKHSSSTEKIQ